jgi:hypothetical protein
MVLGTCQSSSFKLRPVDGSMNQRVGPVLRWRWPTAITSMPVCDESRELQGNVQIMAVIEKSRRIT